MNFTSSISSILIFLLVFSGLSLSAMAQTAAGEGRPDPTGRGRYLQFGNEVAYPGATVLKDLPTGSKCAPAGELVNVPLWNTTRTGYAIVSRLTDKAEVAVVGTRTFLCYCAEGHNELFVPKPTPPTATATPAPPAPVTETKTESRTQVVREAGNVTVNIDARADSRSDSRIEVPKVAPDYAAASKVLPLIPFKPESGGNGWKVVAGVGIVGAVVACLVKLCRGGDDGDAEASASSASANASATVVVPPPTVVVTTPPPVIIVVVPPDPPTTPPPTPGVGPGGSTGPGVPSFARPAKMFSFSF